MISHVLSFGLLLSHPVSQVGTASFYGKENRISSEGKRLSNSRYEAAHKHIPIGTRVKVTSLSTKKSVVVVIVDRGPYRKGRILDLNVKAAKQIGIEKKGIDKVRLEWKQK